MSNNTQKPTLSLQGNYAQEVLSYYLWGQQLAPNPSEIVDEQYANRQENLELQTTNEYAETKTEDVAIILQIDAQEYMDTIGFQAAKVGIFQKFFNTVHDGYEKDGKIYGYQSITLEEIQNAGGALSTDGSTISLNHQQLVNLIYNLDTPKGKEHYQEAQQAQAAISQYNTNITSSDYWQRAFVFGSTKFQINTDEIKYVFDAQTGKALKIQNLQVKPVNDNFDFESKDGLAGSVNSVLKQKMDPSGIGRKVGIEYIDNKYFDLGTFTHKDYSDYLIEYGMASNLISQDGIVGNVYGDKTIVFPQLETNWLSFYNGLNKLDNSGVYNFLDENNRVVIFGSDKSDELNGYTTNYTYDKSGKKYVQIDKDVDLSSLGWKGTAAEWVTGMENSKFTPYLKNGIVYVSGDGNDRIIGTDADDRLIGGDGIDSLDGGKGADRLEGGKGFDTYHVGNKDTISDTDGKGVVFFNGNKLGNFQQDEHNQSLWYEINNNGEQTGITATQQGNNLLIADGNENAITIENYFQAAQILSGSYFGLNIRLNTQEESEENEEPNFLLWQGDVRPNTKIIHKDGEDIDTGIYDVNWTDHSQRDENGFLINGEYQDGFNDVMVGQNGVSNYIYGLGGNDALSGGNGDDVIDGGKGSDVVVGNGGSDVIYGGEGHDWIYSNGSIRFYERYAENDQWQPSEPYKRIEIQSSTWGTYITEDNIRQTEFGYSQQTIRDEAYQAGDVLYGGSGIDNVIGGNGNDIIYGDEADNEQGVLLDKEGNDAIYGMGGDDLIYGNGGDDVIFGDSVQNFQIGLYALTEDQHGNDTIYSGSGDDSVYGNAGDDVIFGEDGDDYLWGDFANSADTQKLADADGNDFIDGGLGNDQILGGGGDDYLMGDKGDDFIIGDYFKEELTKISGSDYIDGGDGNDIILGGGDNDTLFGGNGNDRLWGDFDGTIGIDLVGDDYLDGGDGDDTLGGGAGDDILIGGNGNDELFGDFDVRPEFAHIVGNDYLVGGDGDDYLDGRNGDDILIAGKGSDELWGGAGNDSYLFNNEDLQDGQINYIMDEDGKGNILIDNVYLHQHNWRAIAPNIWRTDTMQLRKIIQDEHTFLLWQSQQHTSAIAIKDYQDGDLNINLPSFLMPENPTQPTVHSNHAPQISNSTDAQTIYINQNWTYKLPENLFTDPDGDTLTYHITNLPNWLTYDEQSHSLTGTASIDDIGTHTLNITATDPKGANVTSHFHLNITHPNIHNAQYLSGSQNGTMKADLLIGDEHNNIIRGLAGDDEIYGKDGEDQINGNNGNDRIDGGKGDDQLHGGNGNDTLIGGEGNDLLNGNAGNDILNGEDGDDLFYGGAGNDKLYGGKGNDRLWGGAGNDYLQGGLGNDTYIFDSNFGQDIINNHDTSKQRNDIIRFKDERSANDFTYTRQDQDLIILAKANDDQITVQNHFHEENEYRIDALHFQDGSILTNEDIANIIAINEQQTEDIDPEETDTYHLEEIMPDWRYEDEEENDVWL